MAANLDPVDPVDRRDEITVYGDPNYDRQVVYRENTAAEQRQTLTQIAALIGFFFGILEGLIGIRVLLRLIDANPANVFAMVVYNFTALFLAPFNGIVPNPEVGGMVLEVSSIIAIVVYALVAWALIRLVWLLFYRPAATRTVSEYERDKRI